MKIGRRRRKMEIIRNPLVFFTCIAFIISILVFLRSRSPGIIQLEEAKPEKILTFKFKCTKCIQVNEVTVGFAESTKVLHLDCQHCSTDGTATRLRVLISHEMKIRAAVALN